jgi:hypothetical protein
LCSIHFHISEQERPSLRQILSVYPFKFCFNSLFIYAGSRDSAVGMAIGYGLDTRGVGVRVSIGARLFSSPCLQGRFWGLPSLLSNGYRGLFTLV